MQTSDAIFHFRFISGCSKVDNNRRRQSEICGTNLYGAPLNDASRCPGQRCPFSCTFERLQAVSNHASTYIVRTSVQMCSILVISDAPLRNTAQNHDWLLRRQLHALKYVCSLGNCTYKISRPTLEQNINLDDRVDGGTEGPWPHYYIKCKTVTHVHAHPNGGLDICVDFLNVKECVPAGSPAMIMIDIVEEYDPNRATNGVNVQTCIHDTLQTLIYPMC